MCSLEIQRLDNLHAYFPFQVPENESPISGLLALTYSVIFQVPYLKDTLVFLDTKHETFKSS